MKKEMELISLWELLAANSVGDVVTAIEEDGIWGWDRFGRQKQFEPEATEPSHIYDMLEQQYLYSVGVRRIIEETSGMGPAGMAVEWWEGDGPTPWALWGWPKNKIPVGLAYLKEKPVLQKNGLDEPSGIPTKKIIEAFKLNGSWGYKLRHINANPFLEPALTERGGRRKGGKTPIRPHLWNPGQLAEILVERNFKNTTALGSVIRKNFPEWEPYWQPDDGLA